ncbi:MAG TPA: nitroreductase [Roseomonas sp.]
MPEAPLPAASPQLDTLLARASVPPRNLREPGPGPEAMDRAVAAALRAPDHGGLRPWRFVCIRGEARVALGRFLAESLAAREPETPPARLEIEREKPLRAPLIIVAAAAIRHDRPGVPPWEQEASAAAGTMNLLHALDALGFGTCWLSSGALKDPAVKRFLGFAETDTLLGWIYVGTPDADRPRPARPEPAGFWREWTGLETL